MDARSKQAPSLQLTWPLAGSLLLTAATVALICERPAAALHSWGQIFSLATLYLLVAACVHAVAVWGVCRVRAEDEPAHGAVIWQAIWVAWIAIVWLPLIALLTSERSSWVAIILPVTAIFGTRLLNGKVAETAAVEFAAAARPALFTLEDAPPLWRVLLPAIFSAAAAQAACAMLAAGHNWTAGCLLGAGAVYPVERWLARSGAAPGEVSGRHGRWTSAANSLIVWLMLVLALVPFLAMYAAGAVSGWMGIVPRVAPPVKASSPSHHHSIGYSGVILFTPRKPREVLAPQPIAAADAVQKPREIDFDGAYWFFKDPDLRPEPNARVANGDPIKNHVRSTDSDPLRMEAHQPLGVPLAMSCCRSLRVNVTNADNVPGTISVEVLLRNTGSKKATAISLGSVVLASSAVSPMPLTRPPVDDSVTFPLPRGGSRGDTFNEIIVRILPERSRSLAGAQVAIKSFVVQP